MADLMHARRILFISLIVLLLGAPVGSAASTVFVPASVFGTSVPVRVTDAPAGATVNFTVGTVKVQTTATAGVATLTALHVATGIDNYTVLVTKGNATETFTGEVYVDPALAALVAQMAGVNANVTGLEDLLAAQNLTQHRDLASLHTQMGSVSRTFNATFLLLESWVGAGAANESAKQNLSLMLESAFANSGGVQTQKAVAGAQNAAVSASSQSQSARSWAMYATIAGAAALLIVLATSVVLMMRIQQSHHDLMVFVLALAARSGITPNSPEFLQAVAAFGGGKGPKGGAESAPAKPKKKLFALSFGKKKTKS